MWNSFKVGIHADDDQLVSGFANLVGRDRKNYNFGVAVYVKYSICACESLNVLGNSLEQSLNEELVIW